VHPLFFLLFLPPDAAGVRSTATSSPNNLPCCGAAVERRGEISAKGLTSLPASGHRFDDRGGVSQRPSGGAGRYKGRFASAVSMVSVSCCRRNQLAMWLADDVWWMGAKAPYSRPPRGTTSGSRAATHLRGLISGSALVGISNPSWNGC